MISPNMALELKIFGLCMFSYAFGAIVGFFSAQHDFDQKLLEMNTPFMKEKR